MTDSPSTGSLPQQPARVLGSLDATCVVIGAIIGVGIFFNPSQVARFCPTTTLALVAWGIGGCIALCGALTMAELGGLYHGSGAQYTVLRDSYGSFPAFLFVFCMATIIQPGSIAVIALICAQNLLVMVNAPENASVTLQLAIVLIVLLMLANIVGVRWGARIQNLTVYAKLATLLLVTALAFIAAPHAVETAPAQDEPATPLKSTAMIAGLFAAMVPILFSYGGWQQVLWVAGEVRRPQRNLPLAIVGGVIVVVIVYLLANWAYLRLLGVHGVANSSSLAADAVAVAFPSYGRPLTAAAVAISAFGVLNVQLLTGPRLIYGMASDGLFFGVFAKLSRRFATPVSAIALLALAGVALLLIASGETIDKLVTAVVMVDAVFFTLTGAAVIVLRSKRRDAERPMRVPGYPVVPMLFVLGEIAVIVGAYMDPALRKTAIISAAWIAAGAVAYALFFRSRGGRPSTPGMV